MYGTNDCSAADLLTNKNLEVQPPSHKDSTYSRYGMVTTNTDTLVIKIVQLNPGGLLHGNCKTNISFLRDVAACNQPLCIALVETHLKPDIGDPEIYISQYIVIQSSRKETSHGGVAMHIREYLRSKALLSYSNSVRGTQIVYIKQIDIVISSTYRPLDARCS